jgi:hypothetical protein
MFLEWLRFAAIPDCRSGQRLNMLEIHDLNDFKADDLNGSQPSCMYENGLTPTGAV